MISADPLLQVPGTPQRARRSRATATPFPRPVLALLPEPLATQPEPSAVIPPKLAMKADEVRLILEPYGLDLVEAAKMVASVMDTLEKSGTPLEAARAWKLVVYRKGARAIANMLRKMHFAKDAVDAV